MYFDNISRVDHYFLATDGCNHHLRLDHGVDVELSCELLETLGDRSSVVLLDHMTHIINHDHSELALHLRDCQFFVHSIAASQQKLLGSPQV